MPDSLCVPRLQTWELLKKSRNIAAINVLGQGLASASADLRHTCLCALLARKESEASKTILVNWDRFDEKDISVLRKDSRRFSSVASKLLASGSLSEKRSAIAATNSLDLVHSVGEILDMALDPRNALATQAMSCLEQMCERWGQLARASKSTPSIRNVLLEKLQYRMAFSQKFKNQQLVDAWLCLVHWEDSAQRGIISDPLQTAYRSVIQRLAKSDKTAVLQLLAGYLWRNTTPGSVLSILCERPEAQLAIELAKLLDEQTLPIALRHLGQCQPLECLRQLDIPSASSSFEIQKTLWLMLAASSDDLSQVLAGALQLAKLGTPDAEQTAAEMLRRCRKPELETLVPAIQVSTLSLGNENPLSTRMDELTEWLKSPSVLLKRSAEEFLHEFTLENLLLQARHWPAAMCKVMANIVVKTEGNIEEILSRELQSPSPKRRMAALQITELLSYGERVSNWLMPLLNDPRLDVRVRVIDLLSALNHEALDAVIPELLGDASTDIQDAANRALRRKSRNQPIAPTSDIGPPCSTTVETI